MRDPKTSFKSIYAKFKEGMVLRALVNYRGYGKKGELCKVMDVADGRGSSLADAPIAVVFLNKDGTVRQRQQGCASLTHYQGEIVHENN